MRVLWIGTPDDIDGYTVYETIMRGIAMTWRAWHVFLGDYTSLDRLLAHAITPEIRVLSQVRAISGWFYIRYWENGPHVRLRLRDADDAEFVALGGRLRTAAAAISAETPDGVRNHEARVRVDGWHADPTMLPRFERGSVHEILYEPEYRRYGGIEGLAVNEAWFAASSQMALQIVAASLGDWPRREALALRLTAVAIAAVVRDRLGLAGFLTQMAAGWRNFMPDGDAAEAAARDAYRASPVMLDRLFAAMLAGPAAVADGQPVVARYAALVADRLAALRALADEKRLVSPLTGIPPRSAEETEDALKSIMMSQVHMTNNRLGLTPANEYRFAHMLLHAGDVVAA